MSSTQYDITDLLTLVVSETAEGLSLHAGRSPVVHLGGEPHAIVGPAITPGDAEAFLRSLATTRQVRGFRERGTAKFIYTFRDSTPFKVQASIKDEQVQLELSRVNHDEIREHWRKRFGG